MHSVLAFILELKYAAMFGILVLCGIGLPVPEEITLLSSGLLVGWHEANFWWASLACIFGILAGDSIIFGLGHHYGQSFLDTRMMHLLLSPARQIKINRFFETHGSKAIFMARFFAGVRIGIYAYAGTQGISWFRFVFWDFCAALISVPASILIGRWAALAIADDRTQAMAKASQMISHFASSLAGVAAGIILLWFLWHRFKKSGTL